MWIEPAMFGVVLATIIGFPIFEFLMSLRAVVSLARVRYVIPFRSACQTATPVHPPTHRPLNCLTLE